MQAAQFVPGPIQTGMDGNPVLQRQAKRPVSIQVKLILAQDLPFCKANIKWPV